MKQIFKQDAYLALAKDIFPDVAGIRLGFISAIDNQLLTLSIKEAKALELRFGLRDGQYRTLREVGREYNLTGQRMQQIVHKALRKLRHPIRSKHFCHFVTDSASSTSAPASSP